MKRFIKIILLILLFGTFAFKAPISEAQNNPSPVLVVYDNAGDGKFGKYLGELLHAEGLNSFDMADIATMDSGLLSQYQVVILGKSSLTGSQVTALNAYVDGGGRLIAMQPSSSIKDLFGLNTLSSQQTDGYVRIVNNAVLNNGTPGSGLTSETLQIHGTTDQYSTSAGTIELAELYIDAVTNTSYPAVVGKNTGSGWAVAFLYDLPKNIIYTRQGNPADADTDVDGDGIIRTIDLFQGSPAWLDLNKVPIPQADEQQRFLGRIVKQLAVMPLPQLWYFPGTTKTILVVTSDAHAEPVSYYSPLLTSLNTIGAHATFYLSQAADPDDLTLESWAADGHSFGIHPYPEKLDISPPITNLSEGYQAFYTWYQQIFTVPMSETARNHTIGWEGWTSAADIETSYGIKMDTNFYHWGPWLKKADNSWAHGYITGSGLPMKFVTIDGTILPVYQQLTQLVDEQLLVTNYPAGYVEDLTGPEAFLVSKELIDASQAGFYSALMTQFHVSYFAYEQVGIWGDSTMAYANSLGIPIWNADEWLKFTESRDATVYQDLSWDASTGKLTFQMDAPASPGGVLSTLVPATYGGSVLVGVKIDNVPVVSQWMDINGTQMGSVAITGGIHNIEVLYQPDVDVSVNMTAAPLTVVAGEQITYTIQVSNAGPNSANNVQMSDTLPAGVTFVSATPTQGSCSGTTSIVCNLNSISASGNVGITLVVNVDPAQRAAITNTASVSTQSIDLNPSNDSKTVSTSVTSIADMGISLSDSPDPVVAGADLTYTATATNHGPSTANGVSISLALDSGVSFHHFSGASWSCSENTPGTVTCDRSGSLGVNAGSAVNVTVHVSVNQSSSLSSTASVSADESDGNVNNNNASQQTIVNRIADLEIGLTDQVDPVTAGMNLVYIATVTNHGPNSASGIEATLALPGGATFQDYSGVNWTCSENTPGTVTCSRSSSLGVNGSDSVNVTVNVAANQHAGLSSTASVSANEGDNIPGNNSATISTSVIRSADVSITMTDTPDPIIAGQDLSYTLTVQNTGPSTADSVTVTDILPVGAAFKSYSGSGWTCQENAGTVSCDPRLLDVGYNGTIQITVTVPGEPGTIENQVSVTSSTPDGINSNNSTNENTSVTASVDLSIHLAGNMDPAKAGHPFQFTFTVSNLGASTAQAVSAVLDLPVGSKFIGASGTGWICNVNAGKVTCTLDQLPVGQANPVTIDVVAPMSGSNMLAHASLSSSSADPDPANNSADFTTSLMWLNYLPLMSVVP